MSWLRLDRLSTGELVPTVAIVSRKPDQMTAMTSLHSVPFSGEATTPQTLLASGSNARGSDSVSQDSSGLEDLLAEVAEFDAASAAAKQPPPAAPTQPARTIQPATQRPAETPVTDGGGQGIWLTRRRRRKSAAAVEHSGSYLGRQSELEGASLLRFLKAELSPEAKASLLAACVAGERVGRYPYFTLWVSLTQLVLFVATLGAFGFAPIGLSGAFSSLATVTDKNRLPTRVCAIDYHNLFLGPRMSDLIRVGAKYSLCMRRYGMLYEKILDPQRRAEAASGCCVQNDGSACYQSLKSGCPEHMSTWLKWTNSSPGPEGRLSGPVCGLDPRTCQDPRSLPGVSRWPDRITEWPACLRQLPVMRVPGAPHYLTCRASAWPCCTGVKGECVVVSRERCELLRGVHFPDRQLCSQVNCLAESCGALGVSDSAENPEQLYRLVLSLFLHSSVATMLISLLVHFFYLRHLERIVGWLRTAAIYLGSGMVGNLVSALALPLAVHVGPSGAQVGALAAVAVEFIAALWHLQNPLRTSLVLSGSLLSLFLCGTLPWFDAFAHLGGLTSGCLLSCGLLPHLNSYGGSSAEDAGMAVSSRSSSVGVLGRLKFVVARLFRRQGRRRLGVSLAAWCTLTACLLAVFSAATADLRVCAWCQYASCFFLWLTKLYPEKRLATYCSFEVTLETSDSDCLRDDRY